MEKSNKIEDKNNVVIKQSYAIMNNIIKAKEQRHVKEQNEPVMDDIIDNFKSDYAKTVASSSMIEILKFIRDEV